MDRENERDSGSSEAVEDNRHSQDGLTPAQRAAKRNDKPPKPDDDALLSDVRQILDPDSDRWWGAPFVAAKPEKYTPEKVAETMSGDPTYPKR